MSIAIRRLTASDADESFDVDCAAFSEAASDANRHQVTLTTDWGRMFGAFDGTQMCGVVGDYGISLTLPGQQVVAAAGVTAVGVLPTHRRRGILTMLVERHLREIAERGEAVAVLTASEATIYRRFGYGIASLCHGIEIQCHRSAFSGSIRPDLPMRLLNRAEAIELAPALFAAAIKTRPGEITRPDSWWPHIFGEVETWRGGGEQFVVACEPQLGQPGGYAIYQVKRGDPPAPSVLTVRDLVAADSEVAAALWRYLLDIDLVDSVHAVVAVDDPLRHRFADWRSVSVASENDYLWARLIDPISALSSRRYATDDTFSVAVDDPFLPANSGTYRITGGPSGAEVTRTNESADLAMGMTELSSLYLGGFRASTLARSGRLVGRSPEILRHADLFFGSPEGLAPHCSTEF